MHIFSLKVMEIIPCHYLPSVEVANWFAVEKEADEVAKIVDTKGGMFALHHSQVSNKPLNFFVLETKNLADFIPELGSRFIINPKIKGFMEQTVMPLEEGCVSFPYRKPKKVMRAWIIKVEYQIPDPKSKNGLSKPITKQVERIIAQIFQHEVGHAEGRNIFFDSPKAS